MSGEPESSRQITVWMIVYSAAAAVALVVSAAVVPPSSKSRIEDFTKLFGALIVVFGTILNAILQLITTRDQQRAQRDLERFKIELPRQLDMLVAFRRALNSAALAVQALQRRFDDALFVKAQADRELADIDIPQLTDDAQNAWFDYWQEFQNLHDEAKKLPGESASTPAGCGALLAKYGKLLEEARQKALKGIETLRV